MVGQGVVWFPPVLLTGVDRVLIHTPFLVLGNQSFLFIYLFCFETRKLVHFLVFNNNAVITPITCGMGYQIPPPP